MDIGARKLSADLSRATMYVVSDIISCSLFIVRMDDFVEHASVPNSAPSLGEMGVEHPGRAPGDGYNGLLVGDHRHGAALPTSAASCT